MTIHYPNGQQYTRPNQRGSSKQTSNVTRSVYGKRGMTLEQEINESNAYYLAHNIAVIHKKPTPVQLVKVDYSKRSAAVIKEAYFRRPSTTDYNGVYRGYYLDFDAKETNNKVSFPLKNFHEHQIEHLRACVQQGGVCFAFLKFSHTNQLFLLPASKLFAYWDEQDSGGRKSIPLKNIEQDGYQITYQFNPLIPYIDAVDRLIEDLGV